MKVMVTIDFEDWHREAINKFESREGLATRQQCKDMLIDAFYTHLSDITENVTDQENMEHTNE